MCVGNEGKIRNCRVFRPGYLVLRTTSERRSTLGPSASVLRRRWPSVRVLSKRCRFYWDQQRSVRSQYQTAGVFQAWHRRAWLCQMLSPCLTIHFFYFMKSTVCVVHTDTSGRVIYRRCVFEFVFRVVSLCFYNISPRHEAMCEHVSRELK